MSMSNTAKCLRQLLSKVIQCCHAVGVGLCSVTIYYSASGRAGPSGIAGEVSCSGYSVGQRPIGSRHGAEPRASASATPRNSTYYTHREVVCENGGRGATFCVSSLNDRNRAVSNNISNDETQNIASLHRTPSWNLLYQASSWYREPAFLNRLQLLVAACGNRGA